MCENPPEDPIQEIFARNLRIFVAKPFSPSIASHGWKIYLSRISIEEWEVEFLYFPLLFLRQFREIVSIFDESKEKK